MINWYHMVVGCQLQLLYVTGMQLLKITVKFC